MKFLNFVDCLFQTKAFENKRYMET